MGFSVSGAAVLLFAGLLVAFGMWSTAAANSGERITDAEGELVDSLLHTKNSGIELTGTGWNGTSLAVDVENTGATQLRVSHFDVVVDGGHVSSWTRRQDSDILRSGETATLSMDVGQAPTRVTVVDGMGLAAATEVN